MEERDALPYHLLFSSMKAGRTLSVLPILPCLLLGFLSGCLMRQRAFPWRR